MSKESYNLLLNGRKSKGEESSFIKGCGTHENLVKYVDEAYGLLGKVVEVVAE